MCKDFCESWKCSWAGVGGGASGPGFPRVGFKGSWPRLSACFLHCQWGRKWPLRRLRWLMQCCVGLDYVTLQSAKYTKTFLFRKCQAGPGKRPSLEWAGSALVTSHSLRKGEEWFPRRLSGPARPPPDSKQRDRPACFRPCLGPAGPARLSPPSWKHLPGLWASTPGCPFSSVLGHGHSHVPHPCPVGLEELVEEVGARSGSGHLASPVQCLLASACVEEGSAVLLVCACGHPCHRHVPSAFTWGQAPSQALRRQRDTETSPTQSASSGGADTCQHSMIRAVRKGSSGCHGVQRTPRHRPEGGEWYQCQPSKEVMPTLNFEEDGYVGKGEGHSRKRVSARFGKAVLRNKGKISLGHRCSVQVPWTPLQWVDLRGPGLPSGHTIIST